MTESAISIFRKLPETKSQVSKYHKLIRQSVLDGEVDPLVFSAQVTALEKLFKDLKSDNLIKDVVLEEAEKYPTKSFQSGNAKFQVKESGVKYDYSVCGCSVYRDLLEEKIKAENRLKDHESFLRSIPVGAEVYNSEGERVFPPAKSSTTIVAITLI